MIPDDIRRQFDYLLQGFTVPCGSLTLATSGTTTTINRGGVSSNSTVTLTPYDDGARAEGNLKVVPAKDAFTITHSATATPRNYRYVVHTPASR